MIRQKLLLLSLTGLLPGCTGAASTLAPASPGALQIADLFWTVLAIGLVIALLVEGLLLFSIFRFRNRPGASLPSQTHGNFRLEITWTLIPLIIVSGIFVLTVRTMSAVTQKQPDALHIKVTGFQWWWQVQYPDLGITTANEIHVPVGQPLEIEVLSGDVIHSFWAPEMFGKIDAIPGHTNVLRFAPDKVGTYHGQCAEFCGAQHANMGFLVIAEPAETFDEWVKDFQTPAATPSSEIGQEGAKAFLSSGCAGCHTVQGTPAQGKVGPDLTHVGSRHTIAALTRDNTPENLASWIVNPQAIKPGTKMPRLGLTQDTAQQIAAYLEDLK